MHNLSNHETTPPVVGVVEITMATNTRNMSASGSVVNGSANTAKASVELTTDVNSAVEKLQDLGWCCTSSNNSVLTNLLTRAQESN